LVNITAPSGVVTYFEFNVTDEPSCAAKNGAYDDVVLARYQNTSTIAATKPNYGNKCQCDCISNPNSNIQ